MQEGEGRATEVQEHKTMDGRAEALLVHCLLRTGHKQVNAKKVDLSA